MSERKPIAVLISDVHYNINTLELADAAMRQTIAKANELDMHLIVCGDLHDTKANLRGECVKAMIKTFKMATRCPLVIVGNHCKINEKSEEHSLEFLRPYAHIVDTPFLGEFDGIPAWLIPYNHDPDQLRKTLQGIEKGSLLIMHQGLQGSNSGEYIQDKSALVREDVQDFRVISGHYHTRQDIKAGRPRKGAVGLFSYVGNPYTLNFGESNDPEKGYQILMSNGLLEFVPTNLRKHVVIEMDGTKGVPYNYNENDLVWVKLSTKKENFSTYSKATVSKMLNLMQDFRLTLIPTDDRGEIKEVPKEELLDTIIDSYNDISAERKSKLKALWKSCVS